MNTASEMMEKLVVMKQQGKFKSFIDYIRFPFFRNLERDTQINFDFPLTVFVGQNGCGKSSTLQALYGAPSGKSVGDYWFSTAVDPIQETTEGLRNCFIYSYKKDGAPIEPEVLKTRIFDKNNPDLWESSEPIVKYGMKVPEVRGRTPPIKKPVVYLDFRQIVSAFDKALQDAQEEPGARIQDFLRKRSVKLKSAFSDSRVYSRPPNRKVAPLSAEALETISSILGRKYTSADVVHHKFFGHWGYSVKYATASSAYSEAFAGSGEIAVVILVSRILRAEPESLLLLDEPETSLHPGAQKRLRDFLLNQAVRQRHQIVICSHSPTLIEGLPPTAIKVFRELNNGKFGALADVVPSEAFFFLGHTLTDKKRIIVEDSLARNLVDRALMSLGEQIRNLFEIKYFPGGCTVMKQDATLYCRDQPSNTFLLLDGDNNPHVEIADPDTILSAAQNENLVEVNDLLKAEIKCITGEDISFKSDGGTQGSNKEQQRDLRKAYLRYYAKNVFYLPFITPEAEIWSDDVAARALDIFGFPSKEETLRKIAAVDDYKQKFALLTEALIGQNSGTEISVIHRMFLGPWEKGNSSKFDELKLILEKMK